MTASDFWDAIGIAVFVSVFLSLVQVPSRAKASISECFVIEAFVYWLILSFGNVVTTLLASLIVVKIPPSLKGFYFLLCPFIGVFAFETILKNLNLTLADRGVLTIQNWIDKALDSAAAAVVVKKENAKHAKELALVHKMMTMSEADINGRILSKLGPGKVAAFDADAAASAADAKQYKIFQLITVLSESERSAF